MPEPFDPMKQLMAMPRHHEEVVETKNRPWWFIILVLLLLLGAGGTYAYFTYFETIFHPPEKVWANMLATRAGIKSSHTSTDFSLSFNRESEGGMAEAGVISLQASGEVDRADVAAPKWNQNLELSAYGLPETGVIPTRLNLKLDFRLVNDQIYLYLNEVPEIPLFDTRAFRGRWLKIDPSGWGVKPWKSSAELFSLLSVTETLPMEKIEGLKAYHYNVAVDRDRLKEVVIAAISGLDAAQPLPASEADQVRAMLDTMSLPTGEIWIGQKDNLPYRLRLLGNLKNQPVPGGAVIGGNYRINWSFSDYNKPVDITPPTSFVNAEQLLEEIFGPAEPVELPATIVEPAGS